MTRATFYNPFTKCAVILSEIPNRRNSHTNNGGFLCGGDFTERNCIYFTDTEDGAWVNVTQNLIHERVHHAGWEIDQGRGVMLMGGAGSETTTEIVFLNGTVVAGYDLKDAYR